MTKKATPVSAVLLQQFNQQSGFFAPDDPKASHSVYGFQGKPGSKFLTTRELAAELKISVKKLERLRIDGGGPPYVRIGKRQFRYVKVALDAWVQEQLDLAMCASAEKAQHDMASV